MVAPSSYVPRRGDIVWLTFNPQAGHEQAGRRPAVVLSPLSYNAKVGLALLCPITSAVKGYPFEVNLPRVSVRGQPAARFTHQWRHFGGSSQES